VLWRFSGAANGVNAQSEEGASGLDSGISARFSVLSSPCAFGISIAEATWLIDPRFVSFGSFDEWLCLVCHSCLAVSSGSVLYQFHHFLALPVAWVSVWWIRAQPNGEFVIHLECKPSCLGIPNMMRVGWCAAAK